LFAFENDGVTDGAISLRPIGGDISPVAALGEGNFEGGEWVAVLLRPKKRETLQLKVGGSLAAAECFAWRDARCAVRVDEARTTRRSPLHA
jgi:hypothetical protein